MPDDMDYLIAETGNITVLAYPELLDRDSQNHQIWGYCLRIENNSDELITLTQKNLRLTDEYGNDLYDCSVGFNGELPDLLPGEYFEYEQTAQTTGESSVLYGFCSAVTAKGEKLEINIPIINFSTGHSGCLN